MENSGVVFIDLLGFSDLLEKDEELATRVLRDFYNLVYELCENYEDVHFTLFSDSLIANSKSISEIIKFSTSLYRECIKKTALEVKSNDKYLLLPRGAIAYGAFYTEKKEERLNLRKHFIISKAMSHAVSTEKKFKGARLIFYYNTKDDVHSIIHDTNNSKSILSELENSDGSVKYSDILWPVEGVEKEKQKVISEEMLHYAIELFKHYRKSKTKDQYIGTLRIGLLSHFKFIASRFDFDPEINILFTFTEDSDFDLWYVLLESLMLTNDAQWLHKQNSVVNEWYKKILLSKQFHHVQELLHRPVNAFIYKRYVEFHNMCFTKSKI